MGEGHVADASLSVVLTNHDYAHFLGDAVDSALAIPGAEVVVVDDGSTDDSAAVLATYGARITVIALTGEGQGGAMNAGWAASSGALVWFLDADDRVDAAIVPAVRAAFADSCVARVHFPLRRIGADGRPLGGLVPEDPQALPSGDLREAVLAHPHDLRWQPTSGNVYRRRMLDGAMPLPAASYRICADHYLNAVSALHGEVVALDVAGGDYRLHGANADARASFDLDKVQGLVARAGDTEAALADVAARLGLDTTIGPSTTNAANRILSLRLDAAAHPQPDDSVRSALRDGIRASINRRDLSWARRASTAAFIGTLAVAPRRALPALATRYLRGSTDARSATLEQWSTAA